MLKQLGLLCVGLVCLTGWSMPCSNSVHIKLDNPTPYRHHSDATNIHALWLTSFLEAGGQGWEAVRAVQFAIVNRSHMMHLDIYDTVHKRKHFSCFNKNDPGHYKWQHPKSWNQRDRIVATQAKGLAIMVFNHRAGPDVTHGATHYAVSKLKPYWLKEMKLTVKIGGHSFYRKKK